MADEYTLYNGVRVPAIGYGTYLTDKAITEDCVLRALETGYRHIDTAAFYGNERETGNAVPLAAITVGNDNSEGYLYPTVLTIDNSVVTADKSGALPAMYVRANTDAANGVTITYGEDCKVEGSIEYYDGGSNITVKGTPITE